MLKKFVAGAFAAGALAIPLSGVAWADHPGDPGGNGNHGSNGDVWGPGGAPGQNPFGPPGQVKKDPTLGYGVPNPFYGVPPGHWNDPVAVGLPPTWIPPNSTVSYPLVWNPDGSAWGVWVTDDQFVIFTP